MNQVADECGGLVLYPEQSIWAHPLSCWNWYDAAHQGAEDGEPALLAGMTLDIVRRHGVDAGRVYVAGLSAGGAMAAILGQSYPHLYAAVGVHSGLPSGSAYDLRSALEVMRDGPVHDRFRPPTARSVSTIVFHGDCDRTVHPSNGAAVMEQALCGGTLAPDHRSARRQAGPTVSRTRRIDPENGQTVNGELWIVHGAGHAWAGGDRLGSFTDEDGPDASREMTRFFLEQRLERAFPTPARRPARRPTAAGFPCSRP